MRASFSEVAAAGALSLMIQNRETNIGYYSFASSRGLMPILVDSESCKYMSDNGL